MSRVDAVRIAVEKARAFQPELLAGAALASDAYFPFADGPQLGLEAGVTAVIQPGGSVRDEESVAAVDAAGATMVATGRRHFRHCRGAGSGAGSASICRRCHRLRVSGRLALP
jgi:phosphoribosylaminoimidazolecarboxamide formyltransferase/IMP cyclohydrolase